MMTNKLLDQTRGSKSPHWGIRLAALSLLASLQAWPQPAPVTKVIVPEPSAHELARTNYHPANSPRTPAPEPGQENTPLLSPLERPDGQRVSSTQEWYGERRPVIAANWLEILGKLEPGAEDRKWFGDVTKVRVVSTEEKEHYTRIVLEIPLESDFYQKHLLLLPRGQGDGPFPAVIAWTSSTPDYQKPEEWWGAYLASRGYVVLTSWSFIRHYREGVEDSTASEKLYARFGHWLPMAKMVHDVEREVEYLRSRREVSPGRIGFMGFSLSAKTAVYVGAFSPSIIATVAIDPHIALNGGTNYYDPWYLDWHHRFDDIHTDGYPVAELRGTVQSLLNPDVERPGFERNHHELLALAAPRPFLLIGGSQSEAEGHDSDDLASWGYFNRAKEVYNLLGIGERLQFASTADGHHATGPAIDSAWKSFLERWLKETPVEGERP
ncbi:MAG: dienelactone hydrolase family protein [Bryobacterales bacterium]|nr:dienelactone hydrolase family protein [Bryobacterales bacterium]